MHPYLIAMMADAHRDELLRQANSARFAAFARIPRHRSRAHVVVRAPQSACSLVQRSAT